MKFELFKQQTSNLFAENRLLKFGFVVLLMISGYNATAIRNVQKDVRTVIVPVGASGTLEVAGASASDDYLLSMARYVTNMVGNYTATSARDQFEELLKLFAPETYGEARDHFMSLADKIEKYPTIASMMVWEGKTALKAADGVMQIGTQKHRLVEGKTTKTDRVVYEIRYEIRNGRFYILSITTPEEKEIRRVKEADGLDTPRAPTVKPAPATDRLGGH